MPSSDAKVPKSALIVLGAVIGLHAVFLWKMTHWLWDRDHYQFFPLVILGSIGLAAFRLSDAKWPSAAVFSPRVACYCFVALGLMLLACIADSHWLGTLSCLVLLWAGVWYVGGKTIAKQLRGPVFFLLLAVPFPLNLDLTLIIEMQKLATSAAGHLLDQWGITHTISGVAIRTDLREFMVEEACSGIHSLFSCVTAMVFWGVIHRYSLLRTVIMIVQTTLWVVVANSVRVFIIVFARHRFGADLENGTPHEILGVCTYFSALLLSLSFDQFLRFLVPVGFSPFRAENVSGTYGAYMDGTKKPLEDRANSTMSTINRWLNQPIRGTKLKPAIPVLVVLLTFLPLSGLALAHQFRATGSEQKNYFVESIAERVSPGMLPEQLGDWKQMDSTVVNRSPDDPLGTNSVVWTYRGNGLTAKISVDGYYSDFHDLSGCYAGLGWELESSKNNRNPDPDLPWTELSLYKNDREFGLSLFSCFDSANKAIQPPPPAGSALRSLLNRLRSGALFPDQVAPINAPVYQLQVMTTRDTQILEHEKQLLQDLLLKVHDIVLPHMSNSQDAQ